MSHIICPHQLKHNEQQAHVHRLLHNTFANHIAPIYMYILGQTHKCTTIHYGQQKKIMCKNYEQIWNFFSLDSNEALMKVFEECQFISWAWNDTVEYDSVLCTSLVSQIWLRRVCLKAPRQLIGLIDWLNRLKVLVRISGYISHKQRVIQIKADQI